MPTLALQPATVPLDAPFPPASAQALVNFVAASLGVSGLDQLRGVVISTTEPAAADRDKIWCKRDPSSQRPLGLYAYNGGWLPIPFVVPSGEREPAGPVKGELFFNTTLRALRFFDGAAWTTSLEHSGDTASRPTDVPLGYRYYDTTIGRELRMTASGWSTVEGGVGDVKMVNMASVDDARAVNPGWVVFAEMEGRFPIGAGAVLSPQATGGLDLAQMKLTWSAEGLSAQGGSREANTSLLASLTLNGAKVSAAPTGSSGYPAPTALGSPRTTDLTPPYKALIFLRKEY